MSKSSNYLPLIIGGVSLLVISGCAPELARTNYGPEEQQWRDYVQGCYNTWAPPPTPAPYSENSTSTSAVSTVETVPAAAVDSTIPTVEMTEPTEINPSTASTNITSNSASSSTRTYVVKKGDSLWGISHECYGDGKYWKKILDANSSKLSGSNSLKAGMVLTIPAK